MLLWYHSRSLTRVASVSGCVSVLWLATLALLGLVAWSAALPEAALLTPMCQHEWLGIADVLSPVPPIAELDCQAQLQANLKAGEPWIANHSRAASSTVRWHGSRTHGHSTPTPPWALASTRSSLVSGTRVAAPMDTRWSHCSLCSLRDGVVHLFDPTRSLLGSTPGESRVNLMADRWRGFANEPGTVQTLQGTVVPSPFSPQLCARFVHEPVYVVPAIWHGGHMVLDVMESLYTMVLWLPSRAWPQHLRSLTPACAQGAHHAPQRGVLYISPTQSPAWAFHHIFRTISKPSLYSLLSLFTDEPVGMRFWWCPLLARVYEALTSHWLPDSHTPAAVAAPWPHVLPFSAPRP